MIKDWDNNKKDEQQHISCLQEKRVILFVVIANALRHNVQPLESLTAQRHSFFTH